MAMSQFEKAVINELQGIKKELQRMNKKENPPGQVDGLPIKRLGPTMASLLEEA